MQTVSKHGEISAALLILLIVLMMILPLPTLMVDILIALNISVSLLLIVLSLYFPGPEAFSTFPTVLLLTTLFRLGIEISTSRLILLRGDAGHIVQTFGDFVAGGNLVVGLIAFLVIAIVQFLVITKGAERVAEVSARFTLDGIPGRQMAIDSDLRAGLIGLQDVRRLRAEMSTETKMHGAMDGAMKFVKGDAIAGMIIVVVNLIGGIGVGVLQHGMTIGDALNHYAILTIGDGLVAQIPALLISITAGMLVTRSQGEGDVPRAVGSVIASQVLTQPKAWLIASGGVLVFAVLPGMPWLVFLVMSALLGGVGWQQMRKTRMAAQAGQQRLNWEGAVKRELPDQVDVDEFIPARPFVLQIPGHAESRQAMDAFVRCARRVRNRLVVEYGFTVSGIMVEVQPDWQEPVFLFIFREVEVWRSRFQFERICVLVDKATLSAQGIAAEPCNDRFLLRPAFWVSREDAERLALPAEAVMDALQYFEYYFLRLLLQLSDQFVSMSNCQFLLQWLERDSPTVAKELGQVMSLPKFTEILRYLSAERVSLRNLRQIAESLVLWAPRERNAQALAEYVRIDLGAQICQEFAVDGMLYVMLLDHALEETLRASLRESSQAWYLDLAPDKVRQLLQKIRLIVTGLPVGHPPPVLLTTQDLRFNLRKLIQDELSDIYVLSFSELTPSQQITPIDHLTL